MSTALFPVREKICRPDRDEMFIARIEKNIRMSSVGAKHSAPDGAPRFVLLRGYKHPAPTEPLGAFAPLRELENCQPTLLTLWQSQKVRRETNLYTAALLLTLCNLWSSGSV
jgi:hypothetical protein